MVESDHKENTKGGILKSLGMRRDGSLKAEQTENTNMVFFYQPLKAA